MIFEILTLFPDSLHGTLNSSILKRAQASGVIQCRVRNIRDFATDRHKSADDSPYGGGPGMVMKPEPLAGALRAALSENPGVKMTVVYMSPQGKQWSQSMAVEYATRPGIVFICGHYEGIDERILDGFDIEEISIGDYVLTGGELPALIIIDSLTRLQPGALHNEDSALHDSFGSHGLLDHPHYTRPESFEGQNVPDVLLSGNHAEVRRWRRERALEKTQRVRPDLLNSAELTSADREFLKLLEKQRGMSETTDI